MILKKFELEILEELSLEEVEEEVFVCLEVFVLVTPLRDPMQELLKNEVIVGV